MPKVDCWRLLGVAPDASAEEVRAGFAKRVRDVHPDSGGTGDALTMRLLVEARDEALELVGQRGSRGTRRSHGEREGDERAGDGEQRCHVCARAFPQGELTYRRTIEGFWGRASKGRVPMCPSCASRVWERRERTARLKAALLIIAAGAIVLGLLFTV
jgi:hypothetical protein